MTTATGTRRAADLMRDAFDAITAKDLDRLAEVWDHRTADNFIALQLEVIGEADLRAFFEETFTALPDLQFTTEQIHDVDENTAVGQWRLSGTFSGGPFQGIEPTGKHIELRGIDVMTFEDGVLRHNDVYYDGLSFARQIGMLPTADSTADRAMTASFNALTRVKHAARRRSDR